MGSLKWMHPEEQTKQFSDHIPIQIGLAQFPASQRMPAHDGTSGWHSVSPG